MWHEARKQEKLIRGMIVDYRRRAERRRDFYEKIKADPTQFLQIHGRNCRIHLDPAVAAAGDSPAIMMPWQGDCNNMIDRFDVRAHLDIIPEVRSASPTPPEQLDADERQCNYERYRILAQNAFLGISEEKFLHQIAIEEQFGLTMDERDHIKEKGKEKRSTGGAAIGYNYDAPGGEPPTSSTIEETKKEPPVKEESSEDDEDDSDIEILDVDLTIDVNKVESAEAHELNAVGPLFGMAGCDLFSFLVADAEEAESARLQRAEEKEKALFSGRKSRRERRAHRDKRLAGRVASPPHYAAVEAITNVRNKISPANDESRSPSPVGPETIQYITSFGGEEDEGQTKAKSYADKLKKNLDKHKPKTYSDVVKRGKTRSISRSPRRRRYSSSPRRSRSRSRSRSRPRRRYSRRSRSRCRYRSRTRSRLRSYTRSKSRSISSRSTSRSRSRENNGRRTSRRSESSERSSMQTAAAAVPRYYGRKKDDKSSSELSLDSGSSEDDNSASKKNTADVKGVSGEKLSAGSNKGTSVRSEGLSLKERLKRKMQAQLAKQLRADKKAEEARKEREAEERARREEELRIVTLKQRARYLDAHGSNSSRSSRSRSNSSSSDRKSQERKPVRHHSRSRSKSRSRSPVKQRIPVWESEVRSSEESRRAIQPTSSRYPDYRSNAEVSRFGEAGNSRRFEEHDRRRFEHDSRRYNSNEDPRRYEDLRRYPDDSRRNHMYSMESSRSYDRDGYSGRDHRSDRTRTLTYVQPNNDRKSESASKSESSGKVKKLVDY